VDLFICPRGEFWLGCHISEGLCWVWIVVAGTVLRVSVLSSLWESLGRSSLVLWVCVLNFFFKAEVEVLAL
jgi:hypothetical protein